MNSRKFLIFESDPALIKRSGDNGGYIYNPAGLFYWGPSIDVMPGDPVMIIPYQPDNFGPWKQCRTAFEEGRFLKCKEEETLSILIVNRFPNQVFKVNKGHSLAGILDRWGISHEMSFVSDKQLEKIKTFEIITLDDDDNDDDDDDDDDDNNNDDRPTPEINFVIKSKKCRCRQ
jgi:hypothetical protein